MLKKSKLKIIAGSIASLVIAFAVGQDKVGQYIPQMNSSKSTCLNQFYREQPPFLMRDSLKTNSYPLCFDGFNVMYSGQSKTPLWVAEYLNPTRLSQKIPREDSFHEEQRVKPEHRALLSDYRGSGYDRGHMAPNGDMSTRSAQGDSFSLANMVPQAPKNNQQVWRELEEATRAMVTRQKQDVYVITGPVFSGQKLKKIGRGVLVPNAVFKAVYMPKTGKSGVYYAPNNNSLQVQIISICKLEEMTGINMFPQLTEEQKRNTSRLPLKASQVKANQTLGYLHWDASSQCAEDVNADQLLSLQKQFQPKMRAQSDTAATGNDSSTGQSGQTGTADAGQKVIDALLNYVLQMLNK